MSGNTSETRCKRITTKGGLSRSYEAPCGLPRDHSYHEPYPDGSFSYPRHRFEPTPPEGEADPLSPLLDMSVVEGLSEELRKAKAGEAVPEQVKEFLTCPKCNHPRGFKAEFVWPNAIRCKCVECGEWSTREEWGLEPLPAPVVSTAAPEPSKRDRAIPRTVSLVTCANCDAQVPPAAAGCIRCGASLMIKNSASENPVAPESYKPAEGPRFEVDFSIDSDQRCRAKKQGTEAIQHDGLRCSRIRNHSGLCRFEGIPVDDPELDAATPVTVEAPKVEEVKADNLFGVYCNGNPESVPKDRAIYWEGWQRVADYINRLRRYSQQTSTARKSPDSHLGAVRA